jgi:hypothetical protein
LNEKIKEIQTKIEEINNEIKKVEKIDKCLNDEIFFDEGIREIVEREENIMIFKKELMKLARKNSIPYFEVKNSCQKDKDCLDYIREEQGSMKLIFPTLLSPIEEETTLYFIPHAKVLSRRDHFTKTGEKKVIRFELSNGEKIEYHDYINYNCNEKGLWAHFKIK